MKIDFYPVGQIDQALLKYAVIVSRHAGKWVYVQHCERTTWEIPGGHREPGEPIDETARRELVEETGAVEFALQPVSDYSVTRDAPSYGRLYLADIARFGPLPDSEIARVQLFTDPPAELTYPLIQPKLLEKVMRNLDRQSLDTLGGGL